MPQSYADDLLSYFTDVEDLRDLFKAYLAAKELPKRILVIHGVGGIGKSSLLRIFRLHCKSVRTPIALASGDEAKSALDVLVRWTEDLKADGVAFSMFGKTHQHYRVIQAKVDERAKKAQDTRSRTADLAGKAASKTAEAAGGALVGAAIGSVIPGIGTAIGGVLGGVLGGMGAEALVDWLRGQGFAKQDIDLLLDPGKKLTDDFLADIERAAPKRRLVLMLDTFEQLSVLEDWARDLAQRLHPNALLVIAGRSMPNWGRAWSGWLAQAHVEELKPMTDDVMRELVRRYYAVVRAGEPDRKQVEAIISFARGLPMVVTSAVQLWVEYGVEDFEAVRAEVVADLVDRLKEGVPEEMTPVLEAAATVRWFNKDVLRAVTGQADVNKVYNELRRFPFMRSRVEGLALHDAVMEIMDEYLRIHDLPRFQTLHERATVYYQERLVKLELVNAAWSAEYKSLVIERLYQIFRVDEKRGMEQVASLLGGATGYYVDFWEALFADTRQWHFARGTSQWIRYHHGTFEAWQKWDLVRAKEIFRELYQELRPGDAPWLDRVICHELGAVLYSLGELDEASVYLAQARSLSIQLGDIDTAAWSAHSLGGAYLRKGWYLEAISVLAEAIASAREDSEVLGALCLVAGDAHRRNGEHAAALRYFERALVVFQKIGKKECVGEAEGWIGDAMRSQGRLAEAFHWYTRDLQTLQELDSEYPDNLRVKVALFNPNYNLSRISLLEGDYDSALRYANIARELSEKNGAEPARVEMLDRLLGRIYHAKGELLTARRYYMKSLTLLETAQWVDHRIDTLLYLTNLDIDEGKEPLMLEELERTASEHGAWEQLAELRKSQGCQMLRQSERMVNKDLVQPYNSLHDAGVRCFEALTYAVRTNRFVLDEILRGIIAECRRHKESGESVLQSLLQYWERESFEVGLSFRDIEHSLREREPSDGSPQKTVTEQIDEALSKYGLA